jgi:hypothetical protein
MDTRTLLKRTLRNELLIWVVACVLSLCSMAAPGAKADDSGDFLWKPVGGAQVKLDDKIPLTWNVFQLEKKKQSNFVLVLLGRRYLLLDTKTKLVYLVFPADIHAQGDDFNSGDLAVASRVIPSTDWSDRDIGPAEEYRLTLEDYGRTLSIQLPHPLDIRLGIY